LPRKPNNEPALCGAGSLRLHVSGFFRSFCDEFGLHSLLETQDEGHGFSRAVRYGAHEAFRHWDTFF
jgi:hypothetical protein